MTVRNSLVIGKVVGQHAGKSKVNSGHIGESASRRFKAARLGTGYALDFVSASLKRKQVRFTGNNCQGRSLQSWAPFRFAQAAICTMTSSLSGRGCCMSSASEADAVSYCSTSAKVINMLDWGLRLKRTVLTFSEVSHRSGPQTSAWRSTSARPNFQSGVGAKRSR